MLASVWSQIPSLPLSPGTALLTGALPSLLTGLGFPYIFNRWIRPALDRRAKLKKYLNIIATATAKYAEEFPSVFDDPETNWKSYAQRLLDLSASDLPASYDEEVMNQAKREFLRYGAQALFKKG